MSKSGSANWLINLVPAAYAVAAATIAAGVYLIDPPLFDLGLDLQSERTTFVGVFLVVAGALLAFGPASVGLSTGSAIADFVLNVFIGLVALASFGFIGVAIGVEALFEEPPNAAAALLLIPGLLLVVLAFSRDLLKAETTVESEVEDAAEGTTPDSGKVDVGESARFSVFYAVFYAVGMFAVLIWIPVAVWLHERLSGILFSGETVDLSSAMTALWAVAADAAPRTAMLSVMLAVIIAVAIVIGPVFQWFARWGARNANRDLSEAEIAFIDASTAQVRAYALDRGYDRNKWQVQAFGFVAVMAAIGVGAWFGLAGIEALSAPSAGSSFPVELKPGGASMILVIFLAILLSPLPHAILSRLWRRYSERSGWVGLTAEGGFFKLEGRLTAFVRTGRLSPSATFRPGDYLHTANLSTEAYFFAPAALLAVAALFLLHRDLNAIDTVNADGIEIVDYWTLERHRFSYGDVEKVVIRCFLTDKGETVEAYELHVRGGRALDIYEAKNVERKIAAYEAVDAKLVAMRVPFEPGAHAGLFKGEQRGYDEACVNRVAESFPDGMADRVRRLFHLDELRVVETIWPWDRDLAKAAEAARIYDVGQAVALYTKAIDTKRLPRNLLAVAYRGRALAREDYEVAYGIRDEEMLLALRDYQKARGIEPTWQAYNNEAWAFIALGAYDDATAAYRKALELDQPDPHWSLIGLSRVERIQGRYEAAMRYLDQLLRVWGSKASMPIYYQRGRVLYLQRKYRDAADAFTKGLEHQTDHTVAYEYRSCAHAQMAEFGKALADAEQAIKLARQPPLEEAWEKTPFAQARHRERETNLAVIKAMAAGTATEDDRAKLCIDLWNFGEAPRSRSPLLD